MKKFINKNFILDNLNDVIDNKDQVIIFYSGIWSFVQHLDFKPTEIGINLLNILEEYIGDNRTIIFPSFTANEFIKSKIFDIDLSLPKESGIIPTVALNSKNYTRTKQPLHSYLAKGPRANEFNQLPLSTSWGEGSVLDWLSKNNAKICVIGIPWKYGCSYFHRFEELYEVPWRYFKKFDGKFFKNKKLIGTISEKKYSSPININFKYDYTPLINLMNQNDIIKKGSNKLFNIQSSLVSDINKIAKLFFENNPWKIIMDEDVVKKWIKEKKIEEILSLGN